MENYIYTDEQTIFSFPYEASDYNAKLLLNFVYEPLFYEKKLKFYSNIVSLSQRENVFQLHFSDAYWSNGEKLTALDMYKTLRYIIENKSAVSGYLDFIEGVSYYIYEDVQNDFNKVKIFLKGNTLEIHTLGIKKDYLQRVFSSVEFSPVYIKNGVPEKNISNGAFYLSDIENLYLEINNFYKKKDRIKVNNVSFKCEKSSKKQIEHFLQKKCLMTSTTVFTIEDILFIEKMNSSEFVCETSNVNYRIEIDNELLPFKTDLYDYILQQLKKNSDILKLIKIDNSTTTHSLKKRKLETKKTIKILYSDYYPNQLIITAIDDFLTQLGFSTIVLKYNLHDFSYEYSKKEYDICLNLINPIVDTYVNKLISYIPFFGDEHVDCYINLLNDYLENESKQKEEEINRYIDNFCLSLEIGKAKLYYLKSHLLLNLKKDSNDNFKFID